MPVSVFHDSRVKTVLLSTQKTSQIQVNLVNGQTVTINKPFPSPVDWRDYLMYQIMTDRFNNPQNPPRFKWNAKCDRRQGGTFVGISEKLDYLQELGIGSVWVSSILKNRQKPDDESYHGYGIYNFLEIDPRFASDPSQPGLAEKEFIELVNQAHARGMYIVLDIVLNHSGDIFEYCDCEENSCNSQDDKPWADNPYPVGWRDTNGNVHCDWNTPPTDDSIDLNPLELRNNELFRRQGKGGFDDWCKFGDFETLKEFKTEYTDGFRDKPVWNALIRSYQYVIALTDVDAFRVDTFKHIEPEFARTFANAIREYAQSIGKENFFIFGETNTTNEEILAQYTGHNTAALTDDDMIGADAQLDFSLCGRLTSVVKGYSSVYSLKELFDTRKRAQKSILISHGEASKFFVTFLDNHDAQNRFLHPNYDDQLTLAVGCLLSLMGIPCIYYGTENGLIGTEELHDSNYKGNSYPEFVREALWGMPNAFDKNHKLYQQIKAVAALKKNEPALRYGRQYFREISGNSFDFGLSKDVGGIIAFSRLLNDRETVIVANTNLSQTFGGYVIVDDRINFSDSTSFRVAYSNKNSAGKSKVIGSYVNFYNLDNSYRGTGYACHVPIQLDRCEIQILVQEKP